MTDLETDASQGVPEGGPASTPAPETTTPDTGTEQATIETTTTESQAPDTKPDDEPKRTPWFQKRIDDLTREKYEARREAEAYRAAIEALRQPEGETQGDKPARSFSEADVEARAMQRAQEMARQSAFDSECNAAFEKGKTDFPDFEAALGNFRMLGGLNPSVVEAALATGEGHKVLYQLGKDPDKAAEVMALPPVRMAVELAKMAVSAPKAKPVSKAPEPHRPIDGNARVSDDPGHMSMEQFVAWREKNAR